MQYLLLYNQKGQPLNVRRFAHPKDASEHFSSYARRADMVEVALYEHKADDYHGTLLSHSKRGA